MTSEPKETEINIVEDLGSYRPRAKYRKLIQSMLDVVPAVYKDGLTTIYLKAGTPGNRAERRHKQWRRGRMSRRKNWIGYYQYGGTGKPSSITLIVDRLDESYAWAKNFPMLRIAAREDRIARTLYHELGHHIHQTKHHERAEPENIADDYAAYYLRKYWRRKRPIFFISLSILYSPWTAYALLIRKKRKRTNRKPLRKKRIQELETEAIAAFEARNLRSVVSKTRSSCSEL